MSNVTCHLSLTPTATDLSLLFPQVKNTTKNIKMAETRLQAENLNFENVSKVEEKFSATRTGGGGLWVCVSWGKEGVGLLG